MDPHQILHISVHTFIYKVGAGKERYIYIYIPFTCFYSKRVGVVFVKVFVRCLLKWLMFELFVISWRRDGLWHNKEKEWKGVGGYFLLPLPPTRFSCTFLNRPFVDDGIFSSLLSLISKGSGGWEEPILDGCRGRTGINIFFVHPEEKENITPPPEMMWGLGLGSVVVGDTVWGIVQIARLAEMIHTSIHTVCSRRLGNIYI